MIDLIASELAMDTPRLFGGTTAAHQTYGISLNRAPDNPSRKRPVMTPNKVFKITKRLLRKSTTEQLSLHEQNAKRVAAMAKANGQVGLYEEMAREQVGVTFKRAIISAGYDSYIDYAAISRLQDRARDINLTHLQNFGRVIPEVAAEKIRAARSVFTTILILHKGKAMIKTMAERIREKDPIAFGYSENTPGVLWFIADWIDEHCDLTLSQLLMRPDFAGTLGSAEVDVRALEEGAARKQKLLDSANPRNFIANAHAADQLDWPSYPNGIPTENSASDAPKDARTPLKNWLQDMRERVRR